VGYFTPKLKAREILPYTLVMMLVGTLVYITGLLLV
jgi:short-chain fatty acids transporter